MHNGSASGAGAPGINGTAGGRGHPVGAVASLGPDHLLHRVSLLRRVPAGDGGCAAGVLLWGAI